MLAHPLITCGVLQLGVVFIWSLAGFPGFGFILGMTFGLVFHSLRYLATTKR